MRFYSRDKELSLLARTRQQAFTGHSQLTVVTGRRRIGKTKLITKSCEGTPSVYFFIGRINEAALCTQLSGVARESLGVFVPSGITSFVELFELLMAEGRNRAFNLVIDEFQEFYNINPAVFSGIQDIWDRYKDSTHVNFIASGSVYTLMHKIFMDYGEPLYGRCDSIIKLRPFSTAVLREILSDYAPSATNDDLLALYTITGGVPKYVELLLDGGATTVERMIERVTEENSIFLEEGNILLMQEFGKKSGNYYAILSAIAAGRTTVAEISQAVGDASVGGMLSRLEEDYELISRHRPIGSKERSQNVRYEIADNFLRFWFRYVVRNQNMLQMGLNERLRQIVQDDYTTYSGMILERWFRQKMKESGEFEAIGSWWAGARGRKAEQYEVDIIGMPFEANAAVVVAEVKRHRKNFKPDKFAEKTDMLRETLLHGREIKAICLTLEDM